MMLLCVVDELGGDKALGVLAHILQLSLPQGEELETMEDRNCQGLVCLSVCLSQRLNVHVPGFYLRSERSISKGFVCQDFGVARDGVSSRAAARATSLSPLAKQR